MIRMYDEDGYEIVPTDASLDMQIRLTSRPDIVKETLMQKIAESVIRFHAGLVFFCFAEVSPASTAVWASATAFVTGQWIFAAYACIATTIHIALECAAVPVLYYRLYDRAWAFCLRRQLHRMDGPAVYVKNTTIHYMFGEHHRVGGPFIEGSLGAAMYEGGCASQPRRHTNYALFGKEFFKSEYEELTHGKTTEEIAIDVYLAPGYAPRTVIEKYLKFIGKEKLIENLREAQTMT